ncbi:serine/threonine-protein kinase [Roseobacter sp.]|uniref:serine/threonine-protein kinase n=1 Tax=Roseobacter sp. TaxID=1907202 RepID=UPI0025D2E546|nr:serine/threonine-protein kinase [Roseobacter sp.]
MNRMPAIEDGPQGDQLPDGARLLQGQYQIERQLQRGGFGITYVARDSLDREVVIKECFPGDLCERVDGKVRASEPGFEGQLIALRRQFIREARSIAKFRHRNIVSVHQVFEENNTAYMALDQVMGADLITIIEEQPGRVTPGFIRLVLDQMLDALGYTHDQGVLHRDISPDNILLDDNDNLTLIDFGAAIEQPRPGERVFSSLIAVKDGYSPHEFYLPDTLHDFSSDLYALGATLFHMITGEAPPCCQVRLSATAAGEPDPCTPLTRGTWDCDYNILATVDRAMNVLQEDRFSSASEWMATLNSLPLLTPPAPARKEFDPILESTISRLVEETNTELDPGRPGMETRARREIEAQSAPRKNVVDIFGNPIEDVSTWLKEQERSDQTAEYHDTPTDEPESTHPGRSRMARLLSRCMPGKKSNEQSRD